MDEKSQQEVDFFVIDTAEAEPEASGEQAPRPESAAGVPDEAPVADDTIQEELGRLQHEVDRLRELYLRKMADFENYRKRQERDMTEFRRFANAELIRDCLPVLDNLERAIAAPGASESALTAGVELVLRQFKETLVRYGLVEIDPLGTPFDPSLHEAFMRVEAEGVEDNTVVRVMQKGYMLGERLLRPALVAVAAGPPPPAGVADDRNWGEL
jgi:molecular chaperone GrpE